MMLADAPRFVKKKNKPDDGDEVLDFFQSRL